MQWTKGWRQRIQRMPGHVLPRRFRLYAVGQSKSGTVTLARKFGHYRAFHEWDSRRLAIVSNALLRGTLSDAEIRAELRRRNWRFNMEVDSAHFLSPFTPHLVELYDDAHFVLLLRDCFSWLDSRIEFSLTTPLHAIGRDSQAARFGRYDERRRTQEAELQAAGLFPIASYFRYWTELAEQVMRVVPPSRLCVVRTEDLDDANERLAAFVGVDPSTIITVHANHNEQRTDILRTVPVEHVEDLAREHCAPLMTKFWGDDWLSLSARLPQR